MSDYITWCDQMRRLPLTLSGDKLKSVNTVKVIDLNGVSVLLKVIKPEVVYFPRVKILGEVAYSLLDYHLNPAERITPNVCPISQNILWREFVRGLPGHIWRGKLYGELEDLDAADRVIVNKILKDCRAQRMALLDFIFIFQDRSAHNWIVDDDSNFWAIDNGMLWPYKGRHADKETARTGKVDHLNCPLDVLVRAGKFSFGGGFFSSLHAGRIINDDLLGWLRRINWREYLGELNGLIGPLGYPLSFVDDWRFTSLKMRINWLLAAGRFPNIHEALGAEWLRLIDRPKGAEEVWKIEWETENSEIK